MYNPYLSKSYNKNHKDYHFNKNNDNTVYGRVERICELMMKIDFKLEDARLRRIEEDK